MRQKIALVASIILGLITVFAMKVYIDKQKQDATPDVETTYVFVANKRLTKGQRVTEEMFKKTKLPTDMSTPDMVTPTSVSLVANKVINRNVDRGGLLMQSDFIRAEKRTSSIIPKGKRLMTIAVDQVTGISGLIKPGNKVDILWTRSLRKVGSGGDNNQKTITLLSKVSVYAIDSVTSPFINPSKKRASYRSVTLFITPREAPIVATAQETGKLTLILRPMQETVIDVKIPTIQLEDVEREAGEANLVRSKES